MIPLTRKGFLKTLGVFAASLPLIGRKSRWSDWIAQAQQRMVDVYVARNGSPVWNVGRVIDLAGGIQHFIDSDDIVVLKPMGNGRDRAIPIPSVSKP